MINVKKIKREEGLEMFDSLRDGRSPDLDSLKISAVILYLIEAVNVQEQQIEDLQTQLSKVKRANLTIKRKIKKT